jgi:hypothetical protein
VLWSLVTAPNKPKLKKNNFGHRAWRDARPALQNLLTGLYENQANIKTLKIA